MPPEAIPLVVSYTLMALCWAACITCTGPMAGLKRLVHALFWPVSVYTVIVE